MASSNPGQGIGTGRASGRQRAQGLGGCCRPTPNLNPPPPRPGNTGPSPTRIINVWWRGSCFRQRVVDDDVRRRRFFLARALYMFHVRGVRFHFSGFILLLSCIIIFVLFYCGLFVYYSAYLMVHLRSVTFARHCVVLRGTACRATLCTALWECVSM